MDNTAAGLWFPLEDVSHRLLRDRVGLRGTLENALSGQMAGAANAALLNPLAVVKFRTWGLPDHKRDILRAARDIYRHGGALAFTRGMKATMARDMVFGMIYSSLRRYTSSKQPTQRELLCSPGQRRTSVVLELLRQKPSESGKEASCAPGLSQLAPTGQTSQVKLPPSQRAK